MSKNTRTRRAYTSAVAALASGMLALTACSSGVPMSPPPASEIQSGGELRVGISGEPGSLDPTMSTTWTSTVIFRSMCEGLYDADDTGQTVSLLATDLPEMNEDNTVATIRLRKGVLFHDGTPMDAEAIKFSLERHKYHPGSQRAAEIASIEEITVIDDHTVELRLSGPLSAGVVTANLMTRASIAVSPTAVESMGDSFDASPVCVGPFKYEDRIPQTSLTLVKDENYYAADEVHLERLVWTVIPDSAVRLTNLRAGELHAIERVPTMDLPQLESDPSLSVHQWQGVGFYNLVFNMGNVNGSTGEAGQVQSPLALDSRIRQALQLSIDAETISRVVFNGIFKPACGFIAQSSELASTTNQTCADYDPDRARELLAQAGVEQPFTIHLLLNQQAELRRVAEMIQAMAGEVGFEIVIDIRESTATVEATTKGDFELYLNSSGGMLDPDYNITRLAHSKSPASSGKYNNHRVDELIESARSASTLQERVASYDEMHEILRDEVPFIFLVRPANIIGHASNVIGMQYNATGMVIPAFAGFIAD